MDFEKTLDLPSCGKLEGSLKALQISSMSLNDEKLMYARNLASDKLVRIITRCSNADRDAVLRFPFADCIYAFLQIRNLSIGSSLCRFRLQCTTCDQAFSHTIDLDSLPVRVADDESDEKLPVEEPFDVELPLIGRTVKLNYLRMGDHLSLEKLQKSRRAKGFVVDDRFLAEQLARRTLDIDGDERGSTSSPELVQFYGNLKLRDLNLLRDELVKREFGIDLTVGVDCGSCGAYDTHVVKLDASFFRPPPKSGQ